MSYWDFLKQLNTTCCFMSRERTGKASNSEIKRWLQNQSIVVNGKRPKFDDEVTYPIDSFILFPKKNKVTLY